MRRVLGIAPFRRLAAAATLNELAFLIAETALALAVYHRTGSALGAAAFFLCAQFGPAFISPLIVTALDQGSARRALASLYALEGLIFLVLGELVTSLAVVWILLLALLQGSLAVGARVLARTAWTAVAETAGALRDAAAVLNSAASVCYLVGPAVSGALVALGGMRLPLFVNVGLFVICISAVAGVQEVRRAAADRAPIAGRFWSAVTYVRDQRVLRRLLSWQAVFMVFFTLSIPVEVVFARHTLNAGAGGYGLLLSAWGGGAIAGSVMYARWRQLSSRRLISLGAALVGLGLFPMAIAPNLAVAIAGAAIAGVGNGIEIVAMRTALQEATPAPRMALILSLNESMFQAVPGIGIVAGGALAAAGGPRLALGVGAAGGVAVAVAMWIALSGLDAATGDTHVAAASPEVVEPGLTAASQRE